jgi:D-glycero-alpha-D-manno-heptose-7-phosphate kinase
LESLKNRRIIRIINSEAPIRICDNGGWTDTWFAEHGNIFNIGVYPYAEVQVRVFRHSGGRNRIIINAENFGERYVVRQDKEGWDRHPLLEAAIERMKIPKEYGFEVSIFSEAPSGASTGTSAAVTVALIGALDFLTPGRMTPHEAAYTAHSIETDMLKQQCGIQDQLCSAYGGINYIDMYDYPHATVSQILVSNSIWWELERRLVLIYLGHSHSSSEVHRKVIEDLEDAGPEDQRIEDLRQTAGRSRDAVYGGDFEALGRAMKENTDAQGRLHPELISPNARKVIEIAGAHGALGWKVNGAAGKGGSITLLCDAFSPEKRTMIREIETENSLFRNIPIYLSRFGLRVWEHNIP